MDEKTERLWGRMRAALERMYADGRDDDARELMTRWIVWTWKELATEGWYYHEQAKDERRRV